MGRKTALGVDGVKHQEELLCLRNVRSGRRREPRQTCRVALAPCCYVERHRGEVGSLYLGLAGGGHAVLCGERPQAVTRAWRDTSRASSPLVGHVDGDACRLQMAKTALRVEDHLAAETRIDDNADALDGERRLGNGRGEDHLALPGATWRDGSPLLGLGEHPVEGHDAG